MFNTIELVPEKSITLPVSVKAESGAEVGDDFGDLLGGVIKNGELGWIATGAHLDIYLMKNKERISSYTFEMSSNLQPSLISCVTELFIPDINSPILAVCVQFAESSGMICTFSVQGSRVLRSLEFPDKITSCCFIPSQALKYSGIQIFDGCLAVGTDLGKVFLIDLCLKKFSDLLHDKMAFRNEIELVPVYNVLIDEGFDIIKSSVKKSRKENCHLSVQLQVLQDSGTVLSMLLLVQQMTLVIGLYDGRMILYDLNNLQAFHLAYPPEMESPLMKLSFIEPLDDPRACIYIWALHYNSKTSIAVMHSIMFEHKQFDPDGFVYYENFQTCSARLSIPLFDEPNNRPINCQSIRNRATYEEEEETSCITIISWESLDRNRINFFVFDLNQWYKDQMPEVLSTHRLPNYLALFGMSGGKFGLDLWIYTKSIIPFKSVQRLEEHFYPNSLSFHCIVLSEKRCDHFHWGGVQNKAINHLNELGSKGVVDPNMCFGMLTSTAIYPQYWDETIDSRLELTVPVKRNFLLSVALEYNCLRLLKECIKLWGDGSHLGDGNDVGVSLSTITDWISQRFGQITTYCKSLCQSFFNNIEQQIDYRLKKQLSYSSKQLKTLEKLLEMVVTVNRIYIPEEIRNRLDSEKNTIKMWYEYYEIILWLSNTDILPEGAIVPYPYDILSDYYKTQRYTFRKLDHSTRNYLFIDIFLENKCNPKELRKLWKSTDGEYPPISLEEMLNILILPKTSNEIKYILILYFFMDLSVALEEDRFCNVIENLIKFPSVFKLNSSIIKRIQAYWKLDHGQHEIALDYLFSPLSGEKSFETWETEFLIETLLLQSLPKLALRVLQLNNPSINSLLEIKTLLANNLISDAFKIQRIKNNMTLLNYFYKFLFNNCKWELLLDYALNDTEIKVLSNFLNNINSNQSENFHIIFLLQRSKYIDAIKLLNKIKKLNSNTNMNMNNTNLIMSAYNMTMTPAIKNLTNSYFNFESEYKLHKEMNGTIEQPFSKQLIENPVNSSFNLHKIVFNSIKHCRNGGYERAQSDRIPFLDNPYINRSANENQTSNQKTTIVPKVINSTDYGKRRSDPEPQDTIDFVQPKKKVMTDIDYKIKTVKDFKQTRKYDFSQSYSKLMESKRNKMTTSDYTFLSKLSSTDEPAEVETVALEAESTSSITREFKTTEDEFFSPEKLKITAEEWNSQIEMSMEIDDQMIDEPVDQEPVLIVSKTDPLVPEEKITPEMWNQVIDQDIVEASNEIQRKSVDWSAKKILDDKITPEMWNQGIDRGSDEALKVDRMLDRLSNVISCNKSIGRVTEESSEISQTPYSRQSKRVSEEKVTPEMWNQVIVHPIVEKSGKIAQKAYERPSKRRALRNMSKTPERSFRRSRTKTPEPLTPSRQSKRLLDKIPLKISESIIEEKVEPKPRQIPEIMIEDFSSKFTKTIEVHHIIETSLLSEVEPEAKRHPVLDDTQKSEFQEQNVESKQSSTDSSEIITLKRVPILKEESDGSVVHEESTDESADLEITYQKRKLLADSSSESDNDEPIEIEDDDEAEINYENDIEEVSEEEEIYEDQDDLNHYDVINILSSSSSEETSNEFDEEDSNPEDVEDHSAEDTADVVEQFVGDTVEVAQILVSDINTKEKIIFESHDLPTESQDTGSVANIIYENMEIDVPFDDTIEVAALNNATMFESIQSEILTQIEEVLPTEIVEPNDVVNITTEPDELEKTELSISNDNLNQAVIITELESIFDDKTEGHINTNITVNSIEQGELSLLNQAMITDDTMEATKPTFVAEPEDNAMTGDASELKLNDNVMFVENESSFVSETKDDSNTLNEALIMVDEEVSDILDKEKSQIAGSEQATITSKTSENPLSKPIGDILDPQQIIESEKMSTLNTDETPFPKEIADSLDKEERQIAETPLPIEFAESENLNLFRIKTCETSADMELNVTPKRPTRGSSVPKSIILPDIDTTKSPMLRKRRSMSTDSHTPRKPIHINKADLEIIMEGEILPVNTPIKEIQAEKIRNTPTRRRSITIEQTATPTTPIRITRRSSISIETDSTPIKLDDTPVRGRKRSTSIDTESISSKVSETTGSIKSRKTNKISTTDSETQSPIDHIVSSPSDYTSNRRLTRHQLAVMEKMEEMLNTPPPIPPVPEGGTKLSPPTKKSTKRTRSKPKQDDTATNSDNESIASTGSSVVSRASSLRSRGSRTSQSNKSSSKGKKEKKTSESTPPADKPLPTIDEDSENEDGTSGPRLRARTQAKK